MGIMIDIDSLLEPVSAASPSGANLRWVDGDTTFATIEDSRIDEDPALVFDGDPKSADWRLVTQTAEKALLEKSKDLQLCVWLAEGLAQTDGFEGLRQGLRLIHQMLDRFWDTLDPGVEDGEIVLETRAKPLAWLASPKGFLPSVQQTRIAHAQHSWADYQHALLIESAVPEDAREMLAAGGTTREAWTQVLRSMDPAHLAEVVASVEGAEAELSQLTETCSKRFGDDAPLLTPLQDLLEEIREAIRPDAQPAAAGAGASGQGTGGAAPARSGALAGPIATRHEALKRLSEVALFFRQTEPHSPVSYLIERAVRWGGMSLRELLTEVVKSNDALSNIWETLGIDPNAPDGVRTAQGADTSTPPAAAKPTVAKGDDW